MSYFFVFICFANLPYNLLTTTIMKKLLQLFILLLAQLAFSQATTFEWAKSIGGQNFDDANSIVLDVQRNVYITGRFQKFVGTQVDFDPGIGVYNIAAIGQYDAFVVKLDANGQFLWAKNFGGSGAAVTGNGITVDSSGNVYTTGAFSYSIDFDPSSSTDFILTAINQFGNAATDMFISKLDSNGNFVWAKRIGSQFFETGVAITSDNNNNICISGKFAGTVNFNTSGGTSELTGVSSSSGFILKINSSGNFTWVKSISGAGIEVVTAISVDILGNVFATGNFGSATDLDTGAPVYNIAGNGIFVLKLDNSGNFIFAKGFVGNSNLNCRAIKVEANGNIFTTGSFQQTADFDPSSSTYNLIANGATTGQDVFLSKLDNLGNFVWAKRLYSASADISNSLALDNLGNVYIAPNFSRSTFNIDNGPQIAASTEYSNNMSILKFDTTGILLAKNFIAGPDGIQTLGISVDNNYSVYTCGMYSYPTDFDPDGLVFNLTSNGQTDFFISKIKLINETLSITQNDAIKSILLFPNPTSSQINLSFKNNIENASVKITSMLGQTVLEKQNLSGNNLSFDVSNLAKGMYVVTINNGGLVSNSKFIKE